MAKGFVERQTNGLNGCPTQTHRPQTQSHDYSTPDLSSGSDESRAVGNQLLRLMPTLRSEPSLDETEAVARELFTQFTREQLTQEGIYEPEVEQQLRQFSSNGYNISSPLMLSVGRDLRRISEAFERSDERAQVRDRAFRINIRDLTHEEFNSLLSELFLNGNITRERIVVLFYFCSDLAISAFTAGDHINCFRRLIQWSLSYIFANICLWVQRQGGWEVVLGNYVPRLAITVCALMGCLAFGIYIKRNLF